MLLTSVREKVVGKMTLRSDSICLLLGSCMMLCPLPFTQKHWLPSGKVENRHQP